MVFIILTSCGKVEEITIPEVEAKQETLNIGITFDTFVIERWQRDRDIFVSEANDLGANVNVQNANGDVEEQIKQITYFIEEGMDVIVIIAIDAEKLLPVIEKAKKEDIKIIAYDRMIPGGNVDLYVSFDNEKVGELMANAIASQLSPEEFVIMIGGAPTDSNVKEVESGFKKGIEETGIQILDITYADNWLGEFGNEYVNNNLEKVELASAIMCGNDEIAGYVIRGLSENLIKNDLIIVGQDADLEACQRIVEGTQYMTVFKEIDQEATKAAKAAVMLAKGEEAEGTIVKEINEEFVTAIILTPVAVTKENMDQQIIEKGYHAKEDVYLTLLNE
jgi:D-xylose transport system substrate-binding protein